VAKSLFTDLFQPVRRALPSPASSAIRAVATAALTPFQFTRHTGHWRSSLRSMAVSPEGAPLPWYTYPCIDFLAPRRGHIRTVLEIGAGQSTLWWAAEGARVVAIESDRAWLESLKGRVPSNVDLRFIELRDPEQYIRELREHVAACGISAFDAIIVDGGYRTQAAALAPSLRAPEGVIICDDSEGYAIFEQLRASGLNRVDFFGFAPGVILPRCTSLYFAQSPLFSATFPVKRAE
jgi:hypothetical protein